MTAGDNLARIEAEIREAAHFYMAHRGYEHPHPDVPEITVFQHTPGDPLCVACRAERNLDALVEIARAAQEWDADLSEYCDGPIRDRLRAALARLNTKEGT